MDEQMKVDIEASPVENKFCDYYRIGLDIGIASVGWACMACDSEGNARHILDMGVRTFDIPEDPQNGSSPAMPRREKRSARRRLRRRNHRLERARELLGVQKEQPDDWRGVKRADVYELRVQALDEKINEQDFARVLLLILKRRGYQSNSKRAADKDDGKVKSALADNKALMCDKSYRTVGEMLYREYGREVNGKKIYDVRNHNDYGKCISREMLLDEIKILFASQRAHGNTLASEETEKAFAEIFTAQRNFDDGPGTGSKYSAQFQVGKCPFEKGEERAAKGTYSFEYFRLLQSVNHIRISDGKTTRELTAEEKNKIVSHCLYKDKVEYSQLRKVLNLSENELFYGLNYKKDGSRAQELKNTEKVKFCNMSACYTMRKVLSEQNKDNTELLDEIGYILSHNKSEERIDEQLKKSPICDCLSDDERTGLAELSFSGFGHMSIAAIKKVLPYLEQGLIYSEAMAKAGYDHANPYGQTVKTVLFDLSNKEFREELEDITSPAVKRAVSQTVKVLNAIIRKYGSPVAINVELARELAKTWKDRKAIEKENRERFENNEKVMAQIKEHFEISVPSGQDLIKYQLWEEQGHKCIYSGKELDPLRVMTDNGYAQVDHIIPYSRSFCDARYNKALVFSEENQKKGNRTPKEYLGDGAAWEEFCTRVNALIRDRKKKEMLLRESFTVENGKEWKDRTLNDTKYISKFVFNQLRRRLVFADCDMGQQRVKAVNGVITSYVRKRWGIHKVREDGDLHHAVDAVVIACISNGFIQNITKYVQWGEVLYTSCGDNIIDCETGEVISRAEFVKNQSDKLPMPHENFRKELECRLSKKPEQYSDLYRKYGYDSIALDCVREIFVSRAPERKAKGAIHKETVYSYNETTKCVSLKTPLEKLKLNAAGEIENYNEKARQSDKLLYDALCKRLKEYDGDGKKAFAPGTEPFCKPKADGSNGPVVKKVLIDQKDTAPVTLERGRANNDGMVRVDIFRKDGKFYGVPVYVGDIYRGILPNKAVVQGKAEENWLEMTDEYEFIFALYKNDLVKIRSEKGMEFKKKSEKGSIESKNVQETFAYYLGFDRTTGAIKITLHDNSFETRTGIQRLMMFEKHEVDMLGNYHKVGHETRPPAHMKKH